MNVRSTIGRLQLDLPPRERLRRLCEGARWRVGRANFRAKGGVVPSSTIIESGAVVEPGVTFGERSSVNVAKGCIVAAGAVVTASTKPDGLYAGVPARRVKDLT